MVLSNNSNDKNLLQLLNTEVISRDNIYLPHFHLYPTHPQILHQLMLELYVRTAGILPIFEEWFMFVPSWPVFRVWWELALIWKYVFSNAPDADEIVLISIDSFAPDINWIITTHEWLHSFFGVLPIAQNNYASWFLQSADMFSLYAKDIESQIPYIRAYKNVSIVPYILNAQKDQMSFDDMLDSILAHHGDDATVVFVDSVAWKEKLENYFDEKE